MADTADDMHCRRGDAPVPQSASIATAMLECRAIILFYRTSTTTYAWIAAQDASGNRAHRRPARPRHGSLGRPARAREGPLSAPRARRAAMQPPQS